MAPARSPGHAADRHAPADPAGLPDDTAPTGLIDCGNWAVSASWTVPSTAVSGVYIAHLVRDDTGVTAARSPSSSATTPATPTSCSRPRTRPGRRTTPTAATACTSALSTAPRESSRLQGRRRGLLQPAVARPADDAGATRSYAEYPMIRFLEANGYDVSYTSGVDVDSPGSLLLNTQDLHLRGHDEYWSGQQRANVKAALQRRGEPGVLQRQRGVLEDPVGAEHRRIEHCLTGRWSPTRRPITTPRPTRRTRRPGRVPG